MTSKALTKWRADRSVRLDRLEAAHAAVARQLADGVNRALVLQLAAEFQGFARELHDEASRVLVASLAPGDPQRQDMLALPYQNRRLARGNAGPSTLSQDFWQFGMQLWDDLRRRYPTRGQLWHDRLGLLNEARNGLAHADEQKVVRVVRAGWPPTIRSVRRWRGTLDGLASGMDAVIRDHLGRNLGVRAW